MDDNSDTSSRGSELSPTKGEICENCGYIASTNENSEASIWNPESFEAKAEVCENCAYIESSNDNGDSSSWDSEASVAEGEVCEDCRKIGPSNDNSDTSSRVSTDAEGNICEDCRNIDFSLAFKGSNSVSFYKRIFFMDRLPGSGIISRLKHFSASCGLCKEFHIAASGFEERVGAYHLRAFCSPVLRIGSPDEHSIIAHPEHTAWLQPFPCDLKDRNHIEEAANLAMENGWTACSLTADGPGMFRPQPISERFNAVLVKKWLSACTQFHGRSCGASVPAVSVPNLVLVDCNTMRLCCDLDQPCYVALSYVWSKAAPDEGRTHSHDTIDTQFQLPPEESLSQVVRDAIYVTKELGYRYLWIDKYCINQRNDSIKMAQIETMNLIYMSADLTIIAAAGEDERYGLPGVGVGKQPLFSVEIGDHTIFHLPPEPSFNISEISNWSKRAWTLQEELLSHRRLYFSEWQVFYMCQDMLCCEARGGPEFAKDAQQMKTYSVASLSTWSPPQDVLFMVKNLARFKGRSSSMTSFGNGEERLQEFWSLLENYCRRFLTYDSDALRAFAGIRRVFEEGECPIYNIQGLPVLLSGKLESDPSLTNFIAALCWANPTPSTCRRRIDFPSWTWAGWTGRMDSLLGLDTAPMFEVDYQSILVEYEDGYRVTWKDLAKVLAAQHLKSREKKNLYHFFKTNHVMQSTGITARDFTIPKAIHLRDVPVNTRDFFSFPNPTDWTSGSFAGMRLSCGHSYVKSHYMSLTPSYLLKGLEDGTLGCVVLRVDRSFARVHLLLLQWNGATEAQRIGKIEALVGNDNPGLDDVIKKSKLIRRDIWLV